MRGLHPHQRLALGVMALALLVAAGAPASQARSCYDSYLDAVRVGVSCGAPSTADRRLQVIDPAGKSRHSTGTLSTKAM